MILATTDLFPTSCFYWRYWNAASTNKPQSTCRKTSCFQTSSQHTENSTQKRQLFWRCFRMRMQLQTMVKSRYLDCWIRVPLLTALIMKFFVTDLDTNLVSQEKHLIGSNHTSQAGVNLSVSTVNSLKLRESTMKCLKALSLDPSFFFCTLQRCSPSSKNTDWCLTAKLTTSKSMATLIPDQRLL